MDLGLQLAQILHIETEDSFDPEELLKQVVKIMFICIRVWQGKSSVPSSPPPPLPPKKKKKKLKSLAHSSCFGC